MPPEQTLFIEDPVPVDPNARYVRVAIERGMDANWSAGDAQGLTYAAPQDVHHGPGHAVMVPLGRSNTQVRGLVIEAGGPELLGSLAPSKVKQAALLPDAPLPPALVELGLWIAKYYVCPLGMAFASMVPAAVKRATGARTETRINLAPNAPPGSDQHASKLKLPPTAKAAWQAINELAPSPFPCTALALRTALGIRSVAPINRLIKLGLLTTSTSETVRTTEIRSFAESQSPASIPTPTPDQTRVIDGISQSLGTFHTHLLLGVTGSGKTEVYIRLVERTLESGRGAIVLVPEISLTPQAATRYASRLGKEQVVVLHSGLTASQRHAGWRRLAEGSARVVVGARSAIFAPMRDIGLIVVDEEHDPSFKQDQLPRYHGKDVAIKRAQIENATVLLGSATPSLESFANTRTDRSTLWRLDHRIGNATMPKVRIVDMRIDAHDSDTSDPAIRKRPELIGPTLARALLDTLEQQDGGQAILLLNRRGFGRRIGCVDRRCGWTLACDHCDANLVWHKAADLPQAGTMRCHHCLAEQRLPTRCPACSKAVRALQIGTQRLEQDLAEWLDLEAGESLLRLDADVAAISGGMLDVLDRFASGQGRVLLGTQMVAKGLDFPNVRLVGVLDADQALAIPDFRASERTFQLVAQVAGRAGRGELPGRVIVQTHEPTSPAIKAAANHDYDSFAKSELRHRSQAALPPSSRMVRLVARDRDHAKAQAAAQALADAIHEHDPNNEVEVLGPMPCVIARIADHYRFAVELFSPRATTLQRVLAGARSQGLLKSDRHTAIDVDPVSLL